MTIFPGNQALRAGAYMVLAMASFVTNDSLVKVVGQSLPVGEIIAIRGVMATLFIAAICAHQGILGSLPMLRSHHVVARATLDLISTILFIMALMHMDLANLTAVMQVVPLAVALLSALVLGERVVAGRLAAVALGFIGVLMIVKPSPAAFTIYDGFALLIVFFVAVRDIVTRRIPSRIPTLTIALANAVFVTFGGIALSLHQGFAVPEFWQVATLAGAAVFLATGYMFMVATLRTGDLSGTAPFRYSIMLFAIVIGVTVFGEYPDRIAIIGMILIVATGLIAASRESRLKSSARTPAR